MKPPEVRDSPSAPLRKCTTCLDELPISNFGKKSSRKDGISAACKPCTNAANKKRREANIDTYRAAANGRYAKNPGVVKARVKAWLSIPENRERKNQSEKIAKKKPERKAKIAAYNAAYKIPIEVRNAENARRRLARKTNPEVRKKESEYRAEYYGRPEVKQATKIKRALREANPEYRALKNARRRNNRANDVSIFCAEKMRSYVYRTYKKIGTTKDEKTSNILGYSASQLRERIECQFTKGMSWDNRSEWHIDHKKPISAFIRGGITDPKTINMLCNLQPLWREDNQSKGGAWPLNPANDNKDARSEQKDIRSNPISH